MYRYLTLLFLAAFTFPGFGQSSTDIVACLRACLQAPEMETAFTQEWGDLRPLYLRKSETPGVIRQPVIDKVEHLTTADFQGLTWEVIPATKEEITQLPAEEMQFGILDANIAFRETRATVNFFVSLPLYPRKWMTASFLLQKKDAEWAIIQRSVELRP